MTFRKHTALTYHIEGPIKKKLITQSGNKHTAVNI